MTSAAARLPFPNADILQRLALSDSGFVFDPMTGSSFSVNGTGLAILRNLQKQSDLTQLLKALQEEFDLDPPVAERDVIEFADLLNSQFK